MVRENSSARNRPPERYPLRRPNVSSDLHDARELQTHLEGCSGAGDQTPPDRIILIAWTHQFLAFGSVVCRYSPSPFTSTNSMMIRSPIPSMYLYSHC